MNPPIIYLRYILYNVIHYTDEKISVRLYPVLIIIVKKLLLGIVFSYYNLETLTVFINNNIKKASNNCI